MCFISLVMPQTSFWSDSPCWSGTVSSPPWVKDHWRRVVYKTRWMVCSTRPRWSANCCSETSLPSEREIKTTRIHSVEWLHILTAGQRFQTCLQSLITFCCIIVANKLLSSRSDNLCALQVIKPAVFDPCFAAVVAFKQSLFINLWAVKNLTFWTFWKYHMRKMRIYISGCYVLKLHMWTSREL